MRRWSLKLAPVAFTWLALLLASTPGRSQDESGAHTWPTFYRPDVAYSEDVSPSEAPDAAALTTLVWPEERVHRPLIVRGQDATNYAPPDVILPSPLSSSRPESGVFVYGSFAYYAQTNPIKHQVIAKRGLLDVFGEITGAPNVPIGLQREALETDQVSGPQSQQPGFRIGVGYRFADGSSLDLNWLHLNTIAYSAVATPVPVDFVLRPDIADSFLFAPVSNFPLDFAGPQNDTTLGTAFGIWNGADVMTLEYRQRNELYELIYRTAPVVDTLEWRTYGIVGPRAVWFWERTRWRTTDLALDGQSADIWQALYNNIISNRLYGVKIGCGNDWYLGNGFSCNTEVWCTPMLNIVQKIAKYERGDRNIGPERKRADRDYTLVPEVGARVAMNWFPYEGIQLKASYDFLAYFNTVTSFRPISFDYSAVVPEYDRLFFRHLRGFELGIMFSF